MERAIVRLGFNKVTELAMGAAILENAGGNTSFDRVGFWEHSMTVSIICKELAAGSGKIAPEQAYTAGLLHDFGKAIFDDFLRNNYSIVQKLCKSLEIPYYSAERRALELDHTRLFLEFKSDWNLPSGIHLPVVYHHNSWNDLKHFDSSSGESLLVIQVKAANIIAKAGGFESTDDFVENIPSWALDVLNLTNDLVDNMLLKARTEIDMLKVALRVERFKLKKDKAQASSAAQSSAQSPHVCLIGSGEQYFSPFRLVLKDAGFEITRFINIESITDVFSEEQDIPGIILVSPDALPQFRTMVSTMHGGKKETFFAVFASRDIVILHQEKEKSLETSMKGLSVHFVRVPVSRTQLIQTIEDISGKSGSLHGK